MRPTVTVEITSSIDQRVLWESALVSGGQDVELADGMVAFGAGPSEAERVVRSALVDASIHGRATVTLDELRAAARRTNAPGLEQLSTRIVPAIGWDDVVLPDESLAELRRLSDRIRFAPVVYDGWGLRRGGGRGEGTVALFAGESGTGKTHAAEAVAAELGLELHTIDLSTVVDKYIGETEKNLERVFRAAEGVNTVLFFDEADALFGKRSEVSDARDRYANIEVSYLLQRLERFRGLAILATNLRGNLDDAFARRLTSVIDFPPPDAAMRARLWRLMLRNVPLEGGLDITALAERFELTGGGIRNAVVEAAFRAASAGRNVGERELIDAIAAEYQKVGRLWSGDL